MNAHSPIKLTDRQEQFCQQIAGGSSYTKAYRTVYGASQRQAESNGSRMMRSDRVQARIAQIRADNAATQRVTLPFLTAGLRRAGDLAERTGQASAMSQSYMGIAKLHGFLIDRQQVDLLVRKPSAEPSSPDEMDETEWLSRHGLNTIEHNPEGSSPEEIEKGIDKGGA